MVKKRKNRPERQGIHLLGIFYSLFEISLSLYAKNADMKEKPLSALKYYLNINILQEIVNSSLLCFPSLLFIEAVASAAKAKLRKKDS